MNFESEDKRKQSYMIIDNKEMLVTIYTLKFEKVKDIIPDFTNKISNEYMAINSPSKVAAPIGSVLFSFINADFNSLNGFKSFIEVWGISGMLQIPSSNKNPNIEVKFYNSAEIKEFILSFYKNTKLSLIEAQQAFRSVVDFCVNADKIPYLKDLVPIQRYFVGMFNNLIPDLYIYTSPFSIYSYPIKADGGIPRLKATKTNKLEDICMSVRTIDFIIENRYLSQNIITFAYIEFFNLLNNFSINKCSNCNKYFIPKSKINEIYCQDCRHIGYVNKVKNNELLKAYNTAYKTKHSQKQRKTYGKSEEVQKKYNEALEKWREEAKLKLKLAEEGKISEEAFKEFLKLKLEV
jgi:DNA-directed RNA polymerase subunit M/transcription elongation factor TFIIS